MRRTTVAAGLVLAGLALAACTGSAAGGSKEAQRGDVGAGGAVAAGAAPQADAAAGKGGAARADAQPARAPLVDGTAKIRVAQLTVAVKRGGVAAAADRASAIALGAGGEVDSDDRTAGRYAAASMQLRVPPDALVSVLRQLSRLGHETSRQLSTTDVTQRVADVNSRVRSAQDSIARLRTLYANAAKVGDIIAIESELNSREADLESLQAQQRTLERQTSMATVNLTLQTAAPKPAPPAKKDDRSGFLGGLERGWDGFVAAASWAATALGTLLPFLVLLAVLALLARPLWRRLPHRPQPTPAPSD